ncbi:hypothetical protein CEXT_679091 [Caerostris extrusa]|uniref:Uncharacterized protein n=1 Tax=Caerostris extrusa TaxID=172846 RepID=A0AAV4SMD5_CAEEX|nr:hypothetical protein CEXT_679091 [Caerostris extrusa]
MMSSRKAEYFPHQVRWQNICHENHSLAPMQSRTKNTLQDEQLGDVRFLRGSCGVCFSSGTGGECGLRATVRLDQRPQNREAAFARWKSLDPREMLTGTRSFEQHRH